MSADSLAILIVIGLIAGWLAAKIVGAGFGLIFNLVIGIIGAFIGRWLFDLLNIAISAEPMINMTLQALVGAVVLIIILRMIKR